MDNNSMSPADTEYSWNYGSLGCVERTRNADKQRNLIFRR